MKNKKIYLAFLLMAISCLAGRYSTSFEKRIPAGAIKIDQTLCDWAFDNEAEEKPVSFTLYIRNASDKKIKGISSFNLKLDGKGLDENFIEAAIKLLGKEQFEKGDKKTPRGIALSNYVKRGMKLNDGIYYEPVTPPQTLDYISSVNASIELNPNEASQITLSFNVPPNLKGYLFKINQ